MPAFTFVAAGITSRNSGFVVTAEAVQASLREGLEGADKLKEHFNNDKFCAEMFQKQGARVKKDVWFSVKH